MTNVVRFTPKETNDNILLDLLEQQQIQVELDHEENLAQAHAKGYWVMQSDPSAEVRVSRNVLKTIHTVVMSSKGNRIEQGNLRILNETGYDGCRIYWFGKHVGTIAKNGVLMFPLYCKLEFARMAEGVRGDMLSSIDPKEAVSAKQFQKFLEEAYTTIRRELPTTDDVQTEQPYTSVSISYAFISIGVFLLSLVGLGALLGNF